MVTSLLHDVSPIEPTTVGVDALSAPDLTPQDRQYLTLTVEPGSVLGPDGLPVDNPQIGISTVPAEMVQDMLPPGLREQHTFEITIQAPGAAVFTTPVRITFPNYENAAPGTQVNIFSFDHTTGLVVLDGTGTVSEDGQFVVSDPGSGIRPGSQAPHHDRHLRSICRLLRRVLQPGAEGSHPDRTGSRRSLQLV